MNLQIEFTKYARSDHFCVLLNTSMMLIKAVACDLELSSMLKSATYAAVKSLSGDQPDDMLVLMSKAGYDAMVMSHLTKVYDDSHDSAPTITWPEEATKGLSPSESAEGLEAKGVQRKSN
ncbi:allantoate amidohydrolase [Perilla frutescens var. hirtella]|nr:allantoate amidohydrolase [Perilla frutescens var. hirtella]